MTAKRQTLVVAVASAVLVTGSITGFSSEPSPRPTDMATTSAFAGHARAAAGPYLSDTVPVPDGCIRLTPQWAGVKVFLVQRRLGTLVDRDRYLGTTQRAVEAFQSRQGIPVTGAVGRTTWRALHLGRPFCMDRFTVQPQVGPGAGRRDRVDAMLAWARLQLGRRYVWGGAGWLGYDCSGLALQAMHAGGRVLPTVTTDLHQRIDFPTASAIADSGLPRYPLSQRRRGDLVFWGPRGSISHMALYLGHDRVIEAVRPRVHRTGLWSHDVPVKTFVVRPFGR
ncbi:MAG: NlpC/P60 family protein [Actinomycetes bacterium]